jgi:ferredoxin
LALDWIVLAVHPLTRALGAGPVWLLLAAALLWLLVLPWLRQPQQAPVAVVDPANCNGCRRCFDDCPYAAVTMVAHPDKRLRQMAQVDAELCASCGICVGACPSSTPFRSAAELVTGIDMPMQPIGALRRQLQQSLATMDPAAPRIVAFGCDRGARIAALAGPDVATFSLVCTGQLPPSFIEYALRDGADGVLVAACAGCEFRLGARWSAERIAGAREPHLRASVPRERFALAGADAGQEPLLQAALATLRHRLPQVAERVRTTAEARDE